MITVVIPTFNEKLNITHIYDATSDVLNDLKLDWSILFIDNGSSDGTQNLIESLATKDKNVSAIFNRRNFGTVRSPLHGFLEAKGDAVIIMSADFQDPPNLIKNFVEHWEKGEKIVFAVKKRNSDGFLMSAVRSLFYYLLEKTAEHRVVRGFYGYGLYDREVVELVRQIPPMSIFIRALPLEFGFMPKIIHFEQPKRAAGESKNSFLALVHVALFGLIKHSHSLDKFLALFGVLLCMISLVSAVVYLILKILFWASIPIGIAPILISLFLLFGINFLFLGIVCSFLNTLLNNQKNFPLVVERKRVNF